MIHLVAGRVVEECVKLGNYMRNTHTHTTGRTAGGIREIPTNDKRRLRHIYSTQEGHKGSGNT